MKSFRINLYIKGIILICLGILTLLHPAEAILSVGFFIGLGLIASGVNDFSGWYFFGLKRFIFIGILDILAGVLMIFRPGITAFLIPFVLGFWLLSTGITRICTSFWLGGERIKGWWLLLLNGLALVIMSTLVFASPLISALSVMMILGVVFIASGILIIIEGRIM